MLFSIQLFGFIHVWKRLCCLKTQRSFTAMVVSVAGSGGSGSKPLPAVLSAAVCQQCTVIWWKPVDVFYSIPMLLQPWDELHEDRHPCHVLVGDVKWWLFYLKLGSDHWKRLLGDLWFGARFIALCTVSNRNRCTNLGRDSDKEAWHIKSREFIRAIFVPFTQFWFRPKIAWYNTVYNKVY